MKKNERTPVVWIAKDPQGKNKWESLEALLVTWTKTVGRYYSLLPDDNPWWYNERASVSLLAGAVWTIPGWAAIEECYIYKSSGEDDGHPCEGTSYGRGDLYAMNRDAGYAFEAKQVWGEIVEGISASEKMRKVVDGALAAALADAGRLHVDVADYRLAATFVVPWTPKVEAEKPNYHQMLDDWLKSEISRLKTRLAACAYIFPEMSDGFTGFCNEKGNVYPGVVLLIEEYKVAND